MRFASFFKNLAADSGLDNVVTRSSAMLGDARHSFDLATLALLTDASTDAVADDIHETDRRINAAEQALRSELIVHVSVQGSADIGSVLGFTLLLKKIERIGDQAKNILELAEAGVQLAGAAESTTLLEERQVVSTLFAEAGELLGMSDVGESTLNDFAARLEAIMQEQQAKIDSFMTSERPGREVVPLAIYYRYVRRIVANLLGIVRTSSEPIQHVDYLDQGTTDTED